MDHTQLGWESSLPPTQLLTADESSCPTQSPPETPSFVTAWSMHQRIRSSPTYTSLDLLLGEPFLLQRTPTLIHTADKVGNTYIRQLMIQLILHYYNEGVVFIDCTNVFPVTEVLEATEEQMPDIDPQLPLRAVQVARAFNYHQATEVLTEALPRLCEEGFRFTTEPHYWLDPFFDPPTRHIATPRLVIVAGLPDLYLSQEATQYLGYDGRSEWYSILELQKAVGALKALAMRHNFVPIITASTAPKSYVKALGGSYLTHSAGVVASVRREGRALYGHLLKHPFSPPRKRLLQLLREKRRKRATLPLSYYLGAESPEVFDLLS